MLKKIDLLDSSIEIITGTHKAEYFYPEIELIYVLEGNANVQLGSENYSLDKDDIILVNTSTPHVIIAFENSVLAKIKLSFFKICRVLKVDYLLFWCNTKVDNNLKYGELRKLLNALVLSHMESSGGESFKQYGLQYQLISFLIDNFKVNDEFHIQENIKTEKQLAFMISHIHTHYMEKITLDDIAKKLFKSVSSLSRFFVKTTGVSFVDYLKEFRIQKVTESLLYSNESITRIAVDNGFSSPSIMNKAFFDVYQMTPSEFRNKLKENVDHSSTNNIDKLSSDDKNKLKKRLKQEYNNEEKKHITIIADSKTAIDYKLYQNNILNVGSAFNLYASDIQEHVKFTIKELNVKYIKIWNVFSNRFTIKVDESNENLNFDNIDRIFDFCVENNILLFVDLGIRKETVMTGQHTYLYKSDEHITFNSSSEWCQFLSYFFRHLIKRYGSSVVGKWIFEFPCYVNDMPYYGDGNCDYSDVWKTGYGLIKSIIPECKIAGPGMVAFADKNRSELEIKKVIDTECIPDIFTMMLFPYINFPQGDEAQAKRLVNPDFFKNEIEVIKNTLEKFNFRNEFWVTEWNNSISNRNHIQDSCYRGTFSIKNILDTYDMIDAIGFWYASDLINVYFDSKDILNGSSGLLTKNGICKPAFHALNFLSRLGKSLIKKQENCIITTNNGTSFRILCYNNIDLSPSYFLKDENSYRPIDIENIFKSNEEINICIEIDNLSNETNFFIYQEIVNKHYGSIMDKWIELGCESELTLKETTYLKRICVPQVLKSKSKVVDNKLSLSLNLQPHEMRFIHIVIDD
ncbi:GH39 family glycosyl hydrolase [Brenneria tiliae]|uniref:Helix-turn-helix domain-containing protein n=1 Tax=Brenneria tiliae TaxID=2914984 RepID=A0ABT0MZN5_9GAMM|nr:helix-turn-helix domain-containing protein [Brenneria tiliae]MCL2895052.1 helix-turn-helix domain-containing protein [Brenneria tiliae]